jgi:lipopolysaccharide assembly protein A
MRWVYLTIIIVFVVAVIIFAAQNFQVVTLSFLGMSIRTPFAVLIAVIYLLGAVTGGSLLALLRRSIERARSRTAGTA